MVLKKGNGTIHYPFLFSVADTYFFSSASLALSSAICFSVASISACFAFASILLALLITSFSSVALQYCNPLKTAETSAERSFFVRAIIAILFG